MLSISFFDESKRLKKISELGDNLEKLNRIVDWEIFRERINKVFYREDKGIGRLSFDYIMMFKILILQRLFNLSDDQTEYQINDRISFMRFLDLNISISIILLIFSAKNNSNFIDFFKKQKQFH